MKQISLLLLTLLIIPSAVLAKSRAAKNLCRTVYVYGIATSFKDSVAYLTDVQPLDSAYIENKRFLGGLKDYSQQMKSYFSAKGDERICTVFFATKKKKAEQQYAKLRKKYLSKKSHMQLTPLTVQEFTFTNVRPDYDEEQVAKKPKKDKKDKKKGRPEGGPDGKRPPMGGHGGGMGGPGGGMGGPGGGMGGPGGGMGGPGGGMGGGM